MSFRQLGQEELGKAPIPPLRPRGGGLWGSFGHAVEGLLHTVLSQRNMKVHVISAILVGLVGSGLSLGLASKVTLIFCVLLVFFAEILNTALEALVDLHVEEFHESARITKDVAAAGVLVLAMGTVVIFAAILVGHWPAIVESGPQILRQVAFGGPLALLASFLLWDARRSPWLDIAATVVGGLLIGTLATWTASSVMTAMTAGLFGLCAAAARRRRQYAVASKPVREPSSGTEVASTPET